MTATTRLDKIEQATIGLSSLATLIEWAGAAVAQACLCPTSENLSALGSAMQWAGEQVERMSDAIREEAEKGQSEAQPAIREVA